VQALLRQRYTLLPIHSIRGSGTSEC